MNKAAVYITFLIVSVLGVVFYLSLIDKKKEYNKPEYDQEGVVYFDNLEKDDLISDVAVKSVFLIRNLDYSAEYLYRIEQYLGNDKYLVLKKEITSRPDKNWLEISNAVQENVVYTDTLKPMDRSEIRELVYNAYQVEGARITEPDVYQGAFDFLDNSVFIFLAIAILWFMGLLILESLILLGRKLFKKDLTIYIYGICILVGIRFLQIGFAPMSYPSVEWQVIVWPIILLLPIFLIYQWIFKWKKLELDIADLEAIKFIVLFVGISLFNFSGWKLMEWAYRDQEMITFHSSFKMTMAMAFAFALGNLLFNTARYLWSMRGAKKKLTLASANEKESKAALNTIQSSVNPHFLYNSLNSIAALAKVDPERTEKMTLALSEFYKYHTNREENQMTTVNEEIEMLRTYLEIEKIRFEDRLQYGFSVEENIGSKKIPHFLLQPIVENAIKYGYDKTTDTISVKIAVNKIGEDIDIKVYDRGADFSSAMDKGFGLKSVTNKLKLFYPDAYEMAFVNQPSKHVSIVLKEVNS